MNSTYADWFGVIAGLPEGRPAHPWQIGLAADPECVNRLIRIPTGFGKTLGVLGAWLWNRVERRQEDWPRRLVWCLPMRVLVEQVAAEIAAALERSGHDQLPVHWLIGGTDPTEWHLHPEREAVLVGTQDMLLSRALNRGYAAARARWPMEFGLLNQDCLWVLDEVQLMDVGLATAAQLQAFRAQDELAGRSIRPCRSWWMSATLQRNWVEYSPDTRVLAPVPEVRVPLEDRTGPLWDADKVAKPIVVTTASDPRDIARLALADHVGGGCGANGPTVVVVNRVETAVKVFDVLDADLRRAGGRTELRLVHSRYRPADRAGWRDAFLKRDACGPGTDRIIVATQVIEAGVDISAAVLLTEIAPWPSLVQRIGRCARWGGVGKVVVIDSAPKDSKAAAPYDKASIDAARDALSELADVAPRYLEAFEEAHPERLRALYPYSPPQLLARADLDDLFDTAPDLSGADTDVSRFIRSGDERDVQIFWRTIDSGLAPMGDIRPVREELCAVPFLKARDWLFGKGRRFLANRRAWVWDWINGEWIAAEPRSLFPGQVVLASRDSGGYDAARGWDPKLSEPVVPILQEVATAVTDADDQEDDESLSAAAHWHTIGFHGHQVGRYAAELAAALAPPLRDVIELAGRWHDAGKAHPAFQSCLVAHGYGSEIAKAPREAWKRGSQLYRMPDGSRRRGFRHELVSALALIGLLWRVAPYHDALLGPWRELLGQIPSLAGELPPPVPLPDDVGPLVREIAALSADAFDLVVYLVCSHHGKVRMSWHASPSDQDAHDAVPRIRGVREGDVLPAVRIADSIGELHAVDPLPLSLAAAAAGLNPVVGRGWTERVLGLLDRHGPFVLAWTEALIRAADQRASRDVSLIDPSIAAIGSTSGSEEAILAEGFAQASARHVAGEPS